MTRQILIAVMVAMGVPLTACDDGEVRFGPPANLRIRGNQGQGIVTCVNNATAAGCLPWGGADGIFARYFDDQPPGNCTLANCHGSLDDPTGVAMTAGNANASYLALESFERDNGQPYVSTDPMESPYLLCNLVSQSKASTLGVGMPRGDVYTDADLDEIGKWVACGMQNDAGMMGAGGAVGMGGMVGVGGAGGQ